MKECESKLTEKEKLRNRHGPMLQYDHTTDAQGTESGFYNFANISHVYCTEKKIWNEDIMVKSNKTVCIELPFAARTVFFPGFPTMKHLKYDVNRKSIYITFFTFLKIFQNNFSLKLNLVVLEFLIILLVMKV